MKVKRIVANVEAQTPAAAKRFYQEVLGLELLMDLDWIATYGSGQKMTVQISFMTQGGSDTPTPDLSIEVDDLDTALKRMQAAGFPNRVWAGRRALGCSAILCARSLRKARQYPHPPP
jgi:catechol 2,3-dioxygenase-like lactoylglutathione lyase family enzyme